jgi:hypothetical protein
VKKDVLSAVIEVCVRTCLQSCECKFVILSWDFFCYPLAVNMSLSHVDTQDFRPAPKLKCKRGPLQSSNRASSSFMSLNQFAVLLDSESDTEDIGVQPQPNSPKSRIPSIVIYSYLNNHSATLKQVNEKLATLIDVKSKSHTLLL